jgi:2-aminobenzoate-CoA ligase
MVDAASFDSFARDNLPPREQWPDLLLDGLDYPEQLNCVTALLDDHVASGNGARPCVASPTETWTYAELAAQVDRIANVLTRRLGTNHARAVRSPAVGRSERCTADSQRPAHRGDGKCG